MLAANTVMLIAHFTSSPSRSLGCLSSFWQTVDRVLSDTIEIFCNNVCTTFPVLQPLACWEKGSLVPLLFETATLSGALTVWRWRWPHPLRPCIRTRRVKTSVRMMSLVGVGADWPLIDRTYTWTDIWPFFLPFVEGDITNELVRHFLIESSPKGVRLKGCPNEPYFGQWRCGVHFLSSMHTLRLC